MPTNNETTKLATSTRYSGQEDGVHFWINKWKWEDSPSLKDKVNWAFYIFLYENEVEDFEKIWLSDNEIQFSPTSPKRITHDYYAEGLSWPDMHGGITYYKKHGQLKGHRSVEIGCDFQHLWDEGKYYTVEDVEREARAACREAKEMFFKKSEATVESDSK